MDDDSAAATPTGRASGEGAAGAKAAAVAVSSPLARPDSPLQATLLGKAGSGLSAGAADVLAVADA